jgi:hypothetical protein
MTHHKKQIQALESDVMRYSILLRGDVDRSDFTLASYHLGVLNDSLKQWQKLLKEEAAEKTTS